MEMKKNHIAVLLDEKGECEQIFKCILADDTKLASLKNEVNANKQRKAKEKEELLNRLEELEKKCESLENEIKVLKGEDYEESN